MAKANNQYVSVSLLTYMFFFKLSYLISLEILVLKKNKTMLSLNMTDMCVIAFMNYLTIMKFSNLKKNVSLNGIIC